MRRRWPSALLAALFVASAVPVLGGEPPAPAVQGGRSGTLDATDRFIVVVRPGASVATVRDVHARGAGVAADRTFRTVGAFAAHLTGPQRAALLDDPNVLAIVPDEVVGLAAQTVPTGIRRIGARAAAPLDTAGEDGVDADIAIVDTGIDARHPDLNVQGGINCSTADPAAWRDVHGHGTHVAGIAAARDDDFGVVGVAPGARLWAVKILNDSGEGLLSWYVCGLDWIAAQRDPDDPDRPLMEAVNMSVAKRGSDDRNCGFTNADVIHQAICRLAASGVTIIAAAANESTSASKYVPAAYDEVITVSALADTDGKPGGLGSPSVCGSYNPDDTFARFSNYGADIDIMAPGKCIRSTLPNATTGVISGTSMAAPHVAGAVALYKASRPWATTQEALDALLDLGSMDWLTSTDPDGKPDTLLDVSGLGPYGDFAMAFGRETSTGAPGGSVSIPVQVVRSASHLERVSLAAGGPDGFELSFNQDSLFGRNGVLATLSVAIPAAAVHGTYTITVTGTEHGRTRSATTELVVAPVSSTGARFVPLAPARLLDTRAANGLSGPFPTGVVRGFQVAGRGGVPAGAVAVAGNLTVTGQSSAGYVSVGPTMSSSPTTSVLNTPARDVRAAGVTVALSGSGKLDAVWKGAAGSAAHLVFDVTGYFVAGTGGTTFRAITPERLLDTRAGNGLGGAFRARVVRTVAIAGRADVPADAVAITANLTVTGQTSGGYVSIGPSMTADPSTSTLNVPRGDVRANSATIRLSETGSLSLVWIGATGSSAHLVLDVTGYFTASPSGATFHPVAPTRIVDSRTGTGLTGSLPTRTVRTFASVGLGPVPADAIAVTGTLTITRQASAGYLALGPVLSGTPGTSNLNAPVRDDRANGFVSLVGPGGRIAVVWVGAPGSRTHAVVDITGFYR